MFLGPGFESGSEGRCRSDGCCRIAGLARRESPSVRNRVDNHHSLTAFGRTPVVERRVVHPEENCRERCVVCNARVEKGLVRRHREDIAVAGIPLVFGPNSYNYYCLDCARAELHGSAHEGTIGEARRATHTSDEERERARDTT